MKTDSLCISDLMLDSNKSYLFVIIMILLINTALKHKNLVLLNNSTLIIVNQKLNFLK